MNTYQFGVNIAICYLLYFVAQTQSIENALARTRNQYLRFYVFHKKRKVHSCILAASSLAKEQMIRTYNCMLSKYYDATIYYYGLSDKERELIEQILNSTY